jgi:surface antigen
VPSISRTNKLWLLPSSALLITIGIYIYKRSSVLSVYDFGVALDSLNHVKVYYNGNVGHVSGRNKTEDGYNLGLKFQCVEFVKRYYYEYYHHKMPDSYGHAKDFFDAAIKDGQMSQKRALLQFKNPSHSIPQVGDLLIFAGTIFNPYGHVAIVSEVSKGDIQLIQQNPGPRSPCRVRLKLTNNSGESKIESERLLGWLRMP